VAHLVSRAGSKSAGASTCFRFHLMDSMMSFCGLLMRSRRKMVQLSLMQFDPTKGRKERRTTKKSGEPMYAQGQSKTSEDGGYILSTLFMEEKRPK
jgi:hypothetical protein